MRILAFGDLHGKFPKNVKSIIKSKNIELVICVGEIPKVPFFKKKNESNEGYDKRFEKNYRNILRKLDKLEIPVFILRGNETWKNSVKIIKDYKNITHKKIGKKKLKKQTFVFFDMIWEKWSHKHLPKKFLDKKSRFNKNSQKKINKFLKENPKTVLISHAPPFGYLDKIHSGKHVGSKVLLNAIKKYPPSIVLCGHIHEARGKAMINETKIYNLGSHGDYKIFNL